MLSVRAVQSMHISPAITDCVNHSVHRDRARVTAYVLAPERCSRLGIQRVEETVSRARVDHSVGYRSDGIAATRFSVP